MGYKRYVVKELPFEGRIVRARSPEEATKKFKKKFGFYGGFIRVELYSDVKKRWKQSRLRRMV